MECDFSVAVNSKVDAKLLYTFYFTLLYLHNVGASIVLLSGVCRRRL